MMAYYITNSCQLTLGIHAFSYSPHHRRQLDDTFTPTTFQAKQGGEWSQPGGHVDLRDRDLSETARREWDEEVIGHPFEKAQFLKPATAYIHAVQKPESAKFPVDTHVFVSGRALSRLY